MNRNSLATANQYHQNGLNFICSFDKWVIASLELFWFICPRDFVIITEHLAFHRSGDFTEPCKSFVTMSEASRNRLKQEWQFLQPSALFISLFFKALVFTISGVVTATGWITGVMRWVFSVVVICLRLSFPFLYKKSLTPYTLAVMWKASVPSKYEQLVSI